MIKRLTLILTPVLLLLPSLNVSAQTQFDECGWMQRSEYSNDEPLTKQEIIEMREQEIAQLANQSEHCLSQGRGGGAQGSNGSGSGSGGGNASSNASGQEGSTGSSGKGTGTSADSASSVGAPDSDSKSESEGKGEGESSELGSNQASSNHLSEGDSSSSSSIAKGTFVAPPVPVSSSTPESDASDSTLANTTTDQTYQGTGNGAPRVSTKSADNKERLRQQLRDAIAATDDPDVKKKLQERLDGLK